MYYDYRDEPTTETISGKKYRYIDDIEWDDEPYQFNLTAIFQDVETGRLYAADDSGCSCPMPFEDTVFEDLTPIDVLYDLHKYLDLDKPNDRRRYRTDDGSVVQQIQNLLETVEGLLAEQQA